MRVLHLRWFEALSKDQQKLLFLIVLFALLQVIEYVYGFLRADVQSIADSVQATMHTAALVLSYFAMNLSLQARDVAFAYGYERVEILTAFTNGLMIMFECTFGVLHSLHHLVLARFTGEHRVEGHDHHHAHFGSGHLCAFARLRLGTDLVGLIFFSGQLQLMLGRSLRRRKASLPPHSENMLTIALKLFGSALAALAALVGEASGGQSEDSIFRLAPPLACSAFMVYLAIPSLISCGRILLLAVPRELELQLKECRTEVALVNGVSEICQWSFWPLTSERFLVGVVSVKINHDDEENALFSEVSSICSRVSGDLTVEVVRD